MASSVHDASCPSRPLRPYCAGSEEVAVEARNRRKAYSLREKMIAMTPPRVLLAEDDCDVRRLVATTLRLDGYSVIEARDGAELLEHVGSALLFGTTGGDLDPVELVISDIRMPGYSGLDVLAGLRRAEVYVPVILVTAFGDAGSRREAERLGIDAFLQKPFEIEELLGVVRGLAPPSTKSENPPSWRVR
jgi:DNA-binding response OmpR family regulator